MANSCAPMRTDFDRICRFTAEVGLVSEDSGPKAVVESVEEYIRRRTREFNEAVRDEPWNLQKWLDYSEFQDQAVALRQTRKVRDWRRLWCSLY